MSLETNVRLVPCPRCGRGMRAGKVKSVIWVGERLYVIEDIPAQVCDFDVEQFYDEDTSNAIRRLTEDGFPPAEIMREVVVPVFTLTKRLLPPGAISAEEQPVSVQAEA